MSQDLSIFPIISANRVNEYRELIFSVSDEIAARIASRSPREFGECKSRTIDGFYAKVAAALTRGLDPKKVINWEPDPDSYTNFIETQDGLSDVMLVVFESYKNDNIIISLSTKKIDKLIGKLDRSKKKMEEGKEEEVSYNPDCFEFVHHDKKEKLYYHLGKLDTGGIGAPNFPNALSVDDKGWRYSYLFKVDCNKQNGMFTLSCEERRK